MDEILQRFIDNAPIAVIVQATAARVIGGSVLDEIFERHADDQYTRELTFSALTRLMTQVVFCTYPSVHAAYREDQEIPVSITSVYNKLNGLETTVSQALVAETAGSMDEVLASLPADAVAEPVPGLRLRILDGDSLAGTDHRISYLRSCGAAALPGMSLVVREGRTGLLTPIVPCEDAYTSERSLSADILALVQPDDLWLADRNFCTDDYLSGIQARDAFFVIRHHAGSKLHPLGRETPGRRHEDGTISEQRVRVGCLERRCIILRLKTPLRDGTTEIRLLTNVPRQRLSAVTATKLYRARWQIEMSHQDYPSNDCLYRRHRAA